MKTALVTGVFGQDGSYLVEQLLQNDYRVIGVARDIASKRCSPRQALPPDVELVELDLSEIKPKVLTRLIEKYRPDEIFNFAARASSTDLHSDPILTGQVNGFAVGCLLQVAYTVNSQLKLCQASSSEIFGNTHHTPQSESTPLMPRNPYGIAKIYAHQLVSYFRDYRGHFACNAILYNHESPRRGEEYVTRSISRGVAKIALGREKKLKIGDLDARRDWGFAPDYVTAMRLMLQFEAPGDYIVATGIQRTVRDFCAVAFSCVGLNYLDYVIRDETFARARESAPLVGNPEKAKRLLGWKPTVSFEQLVASMVDADLSILSRL